MPGFAVQCLRDFIKTAIGTIINQKQLATEQASDSCDVHESDVQKALISISWNREYDRHRMLYRTHEWQYENELMMFLDSDCESYESSYEDESMVNECSEEDEPELIDANSYIPLNELLKVSQHYLRIMLLIVNYSNKFPVFRRKQIIVRCS